MNIWTSFFKRWKWRWVGTVEGTCILVDDKGQPSKSGHNKSAYWNLYERGDGKRRIEEIGENSQIYGSQSLRLAHAAVRAWVHGGPLPALYSNHVAQPPKPKAKLISFPGGKGGAA